MREHTYIMKENYYPRLVMALPQTENVLMKYIGAYRDKNSELLNSPYLGKLVFDMNGEDVDILFKACNINREAMKVDVKKIELPGDVTEKKSLNDVNVVFILLIRYYMAKKDVDKLRAVMLYFAYSIYGLRYNISFRPYGAIPDVMRYTINNLTGKFILKKLGSIDKWLEHTLMNSFKTYTERFERFSDRDIDEIISALYTRISNAVKIIRNEYEKCYRAKGRIMNGKEFIDGTNTQFEQQSFATEVERLSLEYTQEFFSSKPSASRILKASKLANISVNQLQTTMDLVFDNADIKSMREFFNCLFTIYYSSIDADDIRDVNVKSIKFMQTMDSIFRKGNTKDPNILRAKDIMDDWLRKGSETFRKTTRMPTIVDFRRGVYLYLILFVMNIS